jgi:signal transduction histidine kinase
MPQSVDLFGAQGPHRANPGPLAGEAAQMRFDSPRKLASAAIGWFVPKSVCAAGTDAERRAQLMVVAAVIGMAGILAAAGLPEGNLLPAARKAARWYWLLYGIVPFVLRWTASLAWTANLCTAISAGFLLPLVVLSGGHDARVLYSTVLVPVAAILLCGRRAGMLWTALAMAVLASAPWLQAAGIGTQIDSGDMHGTPGDVVVAMNLVSIVLALSLSYDWLKDRALTALADSQRRTGEQAERHEAIASLALHGLANSEDGQSVEPVAAILARTLALDGVELLEQTSAGLVRRAGTGALEIEEPVDAPERLAAFERISAADHPVTFTASDGARDPAFACYADAGFANGFATPVRDGNGVIGALVCVVHEDRPFAAPDVEFAQTLASLVGVFWNRERAEVEVKSALSQLSEGRRLESIGQLAAGVAHEINTPCQYIGDNIEFLDGSFRQLEEVLTAHEELLAAAESGAVDPTHVAKVREAETSADLEFLREEIPKAIVQAREGVSRVSKIVLAMKDFSHPGSVEKAPLDLNRAIESTITVARNEWKYVADLETDFDPDLPPVPCLAAELNQVILNIVVNAAHAIGALEAVARGERGRITVRTRCEDRFAVIEIADTGAGIPEEIRHKIFDPFFTTKEVGKGTGQGLALARTVVVDKHAGKITVASEVGRGTTFRIELPLDGDSDPEAA